MDVIIYVNTACTPSLGRVMGSLDALLTITAARPLVFAKARGFENAYLKATM